MAQTGRPLSPHLGIYRWQVQMVTSILHRATGIALTVGTLVVLWGLLALAGGEAAWHSFQAVAGSIVGRILLLGWSWALFYHLSNGVRHLLQDAGLGFEKAQFIRSSWISIVVSLVLTAVVWAIVLTGGAA